ncbi:MAG: sensor histidine kinase [Blastocatellia bacterium]
MVRAGLAAVSRITEIERMRLSGFQKIFSVLAVCILLIVPVLTNFLAQNSQPSPSPSPQPAPTASVTPSPARSPSPTPLPGAQNFHQWGSITLFNGLPSDSVRAISQTLDGVMWFGTDNGLARFDGRRIQNFSLGGSDANRVRALETTPEGQLWIGTDKGAFVYTESAFKTVEGTQTLGVTSILLSQEIFLGTDTGEVLRVKTNESGGFIAEAIFPNAITSADGSPLRITSLVKNNGKLLAGTAGRGIFVVTDGTITEFPTAPRPIFVNSLARSEPGKLWLGTDAAKGFSGIYIAESGRRAVRVAAPTANVTALEANASGVWAGTERNGLFHIAWSKLAKTYTFENTSGGLRSDTIFTLFSDREGVIWIGTNRGVSRFDRLGPFQETVSDNPNSNFVRTLHYSSGIGPDKNAELLAGTNKGLFTSAANRNWTEITGFKNKVVYALRWRIKPSSMLVGTSEGLFEISGRKVLDGDIRGLAGFNIDDYAAIYGRGVVNITDDNPVIVFNHDSVTSIATGSKKLWIGTASRGLFSYNGLTVTEEIGPDELKSGTIWNMNQSSRDGPLFIAGQHGIFSVNDRKVEQIVAVGDVRDVMSYGNDVWAATTTRGLLHARYDDRFGWLTSAIGFEQGLPSEKAFAITGNREELHVATNRGVVTYKPGLIAPKLIPTRILSQRMHDLGELRSAIELDYPQNSFLVEVAGQSSRTFPEEFQYGFLLKNVSGEILDSRISNDPQYAPADLQPGDYNIEVRAFDRDLLSSDPLTIKFSVARVPFPWTATALGVLLGIAVIALVWAIIERRRIVIRNRELAAARLDLANEAERERRHIARDLHDQTLADLRNLMMASDKLTPPNLEFRDEIESISTEVRRICEDLSPSVLENVGLVAALEFLLAHTIENYTFNANSAVDENIKFPINVQLQLYRIAQEVLTNIHRHADASLVEMKISVSESQHFEMVITNNGIPFSPSDTSQKSGRGVANIRSRASLIQADIDWQTGSNEGNRFWLRIMQPSG